MFFETNCCVLWVISALSSEVVPARNPVLFHIRFSRKLPPPARFILLTAVFHRDVMRGKEPPTALMRPDAHSMDNLEAHACA